MFFREMFFGRQGEVLKILDNLRNLVENLVEDRRWWWKKLNVDSTE